MLRCIYIEPWAFLKEKFDRELSRIKEILAEFIRSGEKSPAPEEAPTRSPSELKVLAEILKGALQKNPKDLKALYNLGEVYGEMHHMETPSLLCGNW